jgi:hypothetical protein
LTFRHKKDSSFLKKRSEKLLPMASGVSPDLEARVVAETDKSVLVLFFKKELLSCNVIPARKSMS